MNVSLPDVTPLSIRSRQRTPQVRLDAFATAVSGPYDVGGQPVSAAPMFRDGNREIAPESMVERARIAWRAGFSERDLEALHIGSPSRAALVGMTQALIDAGMLPAGHGDIALRIRAMQWNYGIGFDAAAFVTEALRTVHRARFTEGQPRRIALADARPGDVISIVAATLLIYSNTVNRGVRVLEVDTSFEPMGRRGGGYRRETWNYDETTGAWTSNGGEPSLIGPGGAALQGVFRYSR